MTKINIHMRVDCRECGDEMLGCPCIGCEQEVRHGTCDDCRVAAVEEVREQAPTWRPRLSGDGE